MMSKFIHEIESVRYIEEGEPQLGKELLSFSVQSKRNNYRSRVLYVKKEVETDVFLTCVVRSCYVNKQQKCC